MCIWLLIVAMVTFGPVLKCASSGILFGDHFPPSITLIQLSSLADDNWSNVFMTSILNVCPIVSPRQFIIRKRNVASHVMFALHYIDISI